MSLGVVLVLTPHSYHSICLTNQFFSVATLVIFLLQIHQAYFHTPRPFHLVFPLPGSPSSFRYQFKCHLLREDSPILCVSLALHSFFFIGFVTICNYLCLFIGFLSLSFSILKM